MNIKKIVFIVTMCLIFLGSTSCRLGEILSEADPETQTEIEEEEKLPQMEKDYKNQNE